METCIGAFFSGRDSFGTSREQKEQNKGQKEQNKEEEQNKGHILQFNNLTVRRMVSRALGGAPNVKL